MNNPDAWQRLAELLVLRRNELGYRFRTAFTRDRGPQHERLVADLESQRRTNFRPDALRRVEELYEWTPGSIDDTLAGGEPTPVGRTGVSRYIEDFTDEELLAEIGRRFRESDPELLNAVDPDARGKSRQRSTRGQKPRRMRPQANET